MSADVEKPVEPPLYTKLKPAELAALEALYAAEIAEAMNNGRFQPLDSKKCPPRVMGVLCALGLAEKVTRTLPPPPGDIPIPTRVETYVLTLHGNMTFCDYCASLPDMEEDPEALPDASLAMPPETGEGEVPQYARPY